MNGNEHAGQPSLSAEEWITSPRLRLAVQSVARRLGLPAEDRDDLLQEVALVLWRSRTDAQLNSSYVFRAALHRAIDLFFRGRKTETRTTLPTGQIDLFLLLRAGISALPPRQQRVCRMLFLEGLSEREAADHLQISRGAVQRLEREVLRLLRGRVRVPVSGQRSAVSGQRSAETQALINRVSRIFTRPLRFLAY